MTQSIQEQALTKRQNDRQDKQETINTLNIRYGIDLLPPAATALKGQDPSSKLSCLLPWILTQPSDMERPLVNLKASDSKQLCRENHVSL